MRARPSERGLASLQMLLITAPFLGASFMTLHFLLIAKADLVVRHAATRAARAAATALDDQEDHYDGEARGAATGARAEAVRAAALEALKAIAPTPKMFEGRNLASLLPDDNSREAMAEEWNEGAAKVSFLGPGGTSVLSQFGPDDEVTVRVTFLYPCALPLVDRGCHDLATLPLEPGDRPDVELLASRFPNVRVWVFQHEATLPIQGAHYDYGEDP